MPERQKPSLPHLPRTDTGTSGADSETPEPDAIPGECVVSFRTEREFRVFLNGVSTNSIEILDAIPRSRAVRLRAGSQDALARLLAETGGIEKSAANYRIRRPDLPSMNPPVPTGSYFAFGSMAIDWLGMEKKREGGGKGITVAILDVGVLQHPALSEKRIRRIDLVNEIAATDPSLQNGHGTAMAGIVAGNSSQVRGLVPSADILSIKVAGSDGTGDAFTLAKGVIEAVNQGVNIISISLGGRGDSFVLEQAIDYARVRGVIVVAAAGNEGENGVCYPARYAGAVAVTAVDAAGRHPWFAGTGSEVALSAPGIGVSTAGQAGETIEVSGTSVATPFVAGALAYLISAEPTTAPDEFVELMITYADDVGPPGKDSEYGSGILNIGRIMQRTAKGVYDLAIADHYLASADGEAMIPLVVSVQNRGTEPLPEVTLRVEVGNKMQELNLGWIDVCETVGYTFKLDRTEIEKAGFIEIRSEASAAGIRDINPLNDSKITRVRLVSID
jgi:subtilisin family serine protease